MELRSQTDRLKTLRQKMQEYIDSGVRLGWMFNSRDRQIEIYRPGLPPEIRQLPTEIDGESVLPGFVLQVERFSEEENDMEFLLEYELLAIDRTTVLRIDL